MGGGNVGAGRGTGGPGLGGGPGPVLGGAFSFSTVIVAGGRFCQTLIIGGHAFCVEDDSVLSSLGARWVCRTVGDADAAPFWEAPPVCFVGAFRTSSLVSFASPAEADLSAPEDSEALSACSSFSTALSRSLVR